MTKPMNFPGRKRARREVALNRLEAAWPESDETPPQRVIVEKEALARGIADNIVRRFTKKPAAGRLRPFARISA